MPINKDSLPLGCLCKGETFLPMGKRQGLPVSPLQTPDYGEKILILPMPISG
ncbi:hypothetical protein MiSe_39680 [Microseira wollei NIES-4236]|uniref:Uncharacterized protein n=1 Tax=Microseira wollei NIES-4236 TaxID=2530354 RepID=A0AAV3WIE6_9CYAN|nr:hypothetical protein MiSe_39680 [Microseira wollei NIES-4236]